MNRYDTLLIANRGEIVVRVARSARARGLRTVAVASDADRDAPHTHACDSIVAIGGERAADSYLRIDALIDAARTSGAQAVHPGYGFLSENAAFAQAVLDAGLVWVGPPPDAMRAMADKSHARRRLAARLPGVPVLPGYDGDDQARDTLRAEALRIGMPLMIKAAAGGGGRGMRLVRDAGELDAALDAAAAEALAAFGDARLLIERALIAPRHVEVQLLADAHGRVIHLGERDCSVQRRHQKIVEEAPSPAVDPTLRRRLGDAAVAVAREVGYVGAGTVEFLLDADGSFWFMEMNTRLQVEHPLTEALTGLDLVDWQLRIAAGEALSVTQDDALARYERGGHAIEVRLCAEDPAHGFLPQSGRIAAWHPPHGVRVEHALAAGAAVSPHYDSMIAKLIAHAHDRAAAIATLADALDRTVCLGLPTNRAFLARVLRDPAFDEARVSTAFIAEHYGSDAARADPPPSWLRALAAASHALLPAAPLPALWSGWGMGAAIDTVAPIRIGLYIEGENGGDERWQLRGTRDALSATNGRDTHRIDGLRRDSRSRVSARVDGRPVQAQAAAADGQTWWQAGPHEAAIADLRLASAAARRADAGDGVRAPMHGRVTQVLVQAGARVEAGALLLVMEAMKMEHRLHAPRAGAVAALHARVGEQVAARQLLAEIA